jgi:hypothetical protein
MPCVLLLVRDTLVRDGTVRERRSREAFRDSWRGRTWAKGYLLRLFAHLTPPLTWLTWLTWAGRLI